MIPLFDLHSDTLLEIYKRKLSFFDNTELHISLKRAHPFSPYIQVASVWSDAMLDDEGAYLQYLDVIKYAKNSSLFFTTSPSNLRDFSLILALEDARILCGDISRLERLHSDGVRVLTLNWKGISSIGGAWDTDFSLSQFGIDTVKACFELGILPDISHSSAVACNQVLDLCEKYGFATLASHSNAYSICKHKRNLTDDLFIRMREHGFVVGISLVPEHISKNDATIYDVLKHIEHYLSLEGESIISLGCDFDGTSSLPKEISSIEDLTILYNEVSCAFGRDVAQKLFFKNAYRFMVKNLK